MQDAFTIRIAELTARVQPLFVTTREYCRAYLSDSEPELYIEISENDLVHEQEIAEKEAVEEGLRIRKFTGPFLERAAIQRRIARELLNRDTLLLHGSTVAVDGNAFLFTAPCRTGKSTHTRFWREVFGDRAVMVNDDKPFLQITPSGVLAFGSPWSGKHGLDTNICLPLKGICFLQRGKENVILRASPEDCMAELLHQSFIPEDPVGQARALALTAALARQVPMWKMDCTKDPAAALVSHQAMSECN